MHEMSMAMSIVELVSEKARQAGAEKVTAIELEVGRLSGVMPEALSFCFAAAARGTPAEEARLDISEPAGEGRCRDCGLVFAVNALPGQCPECLGYAVGVAGGRELRVIAFSVEDNNEKQVRDV